jgi:fibronectin-binding autotransporter adhesin
MALIKTGAGTQVLSGSNTYTGATTINAGTLQIGAGSTTGSLSTSSAITNNGTLVFNRSNAVSQGTDFATVISGSGNVTQAGAGTLTLNGTNTYTGATTISAGTLQIGTGGTTGSLSASSAITNNGTLVFNRSDDLSQGTQFSSAAITGTGSLVKNGTGALTLSVNNTFTGGVTLNAGTLNINSATALGNATVGTFVINGGTIDNTSVGTITVGAKPLTINGDFTFNGTNALSLGTGATTLGTAAGTSRTITVNANTLTIGGIIANGTTANSIIKEGAGTLTLTNTNTFTGGLTINSGTAATGTIAGFGAAGNTVSFGGGAAGNGTILIQKSTANVMFTNLDVTGANGTIISDNSASGAGQTHSMVNAQLGNGYQLSIRGGTNVASSTGRFDLTGLTTMAGNA